MRPSISSPRGAGKQREKLLTLAYRFNGVELDAAEHAQSLGKDREPLRRGLLLDHVVLHGGWVLDQRKWQIV